MGRHQITSRIYGARRKLPDKEAFLTIGTFEPHVSIGHKWADLMSKGWDGKWKNQKILSSR